MKIVQLRFQNLNSLVGEWQIDFTDPAFVADGIFAITGPTGAGKSSILDAICLALYGRTPRLGRITKSSNEIMSRQTGECFAEVTLLRLVAVIAAIGASTVQGANRTASCNNPGRNWSMPPVARCWNRSCVKWNRPW